MMITPPRPKILKGCGLDKRALVMEHVHWTVSHGEICG